MRHKSLRDMKFYFNDDLILCTAHVHDKWVYKNQGNTNFIVIIMKKEYVLQIRGIVVI